MRKTTLLAIATAALAVITVVTSLIRTDSGPAGKVSTSTAVQQVHTATSLAPRNFDAI
jgi:hypothetical protein